MTYDTIWAEVSCEVPTAMVDALSEFLVEVTGGGVSIENRQLDTFSLDTVEDTPVKTVKAYVSDGPELQGILAQLKKFLHENGAAVAGFLYVDPVVQYIHEEDWANNWKVNFKPTRIGRTMILKPSWEEYPVVAGDVIIELDPGMAFGTGTHATTRLCLEAIEDIFQHEAPYDVSISKTQSILDVGTGSGVLAIAAAKLGADQVLGIDIDPGAVAVANENIGLNGVERSAAATCEPLEKLQGEYSMVIANILAEDLVRMAAELVDKVAEGGFLILSGILTEKEELVRAGFADFPVKFLKGTRQEEWSCLVYFRVH